MVQRKCLYCQKLILEDYLRRLCLDRSEVYIYAELLPEIGEKELQHGAERVGAEDSDTLPAGCKTDCRKQSEKPEEVVAVDVTDENRVDALERKMLTAKLALGAFPAVNQKQAPTYIQYLSA